MGVNFQLKNKCSIFILDDTKELKTKECQRLLETSPDWVVCERDDYDRNGYSIYKKVSNEPIVTD